MLLSTQAAKRLAYREPRQSSASSPRNLLIVTQLLSANLTYSHGAGGHAGFLMILDGDAVVSSALTCSWLRSLPLRQPHHHYPCTLSHAPWPQIQLHDLVSSPFFSRNGEWLEIQRRKLLQNTHQLSPTTENHLTGICPQPSHAAAAISHSDLKPQPSFSWVTRVMTEMPGTRPPLLKRGKTHFSLSPLLSTAQNPGCCIYNEHKKTMKGD